MIAVRMPPDRTDDAVPASGYISARARIAFLHVAGGENLLLTGLGRELAADVAI